MSQSKLFARRKQRQAAAGSDSFTTDRGLEPKEMDTEGVRLSSATAVKTAGDEKSQGRYVTLVQTVTNKLQLIPNPATIKEFILDNKHHLPTQALEALVLDVEPGRKSNMIWSDDTVLFELLDDLTSNGWRWLDPSDIGALTSAPIVEAPDGRVYWHERYQIESAGEALLLGTTVKFDGAPENKPLTSLGDDLQSPETPLTPEIPGKLSSKKTAEEHGETLPTATATSDLPTPAPSVPATGVTSGKYKYWTAEALSEVIETLSGISDFTNDKAAQQAVAEMAEELNARPKATPEQKAAAKKASVDPDTKRQLDYAIEGIYKFQIDGEQGTELITKALQSLKNIATTSLSPDQKAGLDRAISELEAYDEGNDGDIARAVVELEDVAGTNWSTPEHPAFTQTAAYGSFAVNEDTSKVLEGDKSIPDGRDQVEDNTGIVRPSGTTTPSKVAAIPVSNDETSKVLEGDKSIPDGRKDVEDNTGITRPSTESPSKFAAEKAEYKGAACAHAASEDHMVCAKCGKCREDLDSDDVCQACGGRDENKTAALKTAGPMLEKITPEDFSLSETGVLGALRKLLYKTDGSYNKHQILGLVEKAEEMASKTAAGKTAGPLLEKVTPVDAGLSETGLLGAVRKLLYKMDGSYNKYQILELVEKASKTSSAKTAGPLLEKITPEDFSLSETGVLGALRKLLYKMDGSYNKHQILGLVEKAEEIAKHPGTESVEQAIVASSKTAGETESRLRAVAHYKHVQAVESVYSVARTAVTAASKEAGEISTAKALSLAETMSEKLKALYLDAKPLTAVNGTRPVREAVESVYAAMALFGEAAKALAKQDKQEKEEAVAAEAALPKKKAAQEAKAASVRLGGLRIAGATAASEQ